MSDVEWRPTNCPCELHPLNWDEEIQASLEEARVRGRLEALAPVLDLIGWWETDGTAERKAAAARIRAVIAGGNDQ